MIIYLVNIDHEIEGRVAFPTLAEAVKCRKNNGTPGLDGEIQRVDVNVKSRAAICAIFNRLGFANGWSTVMPALPNPPLPSKESKKP